MQYLRHVSSAVLLSLMLLVLSSCHISIRSKNDTVTNGIRLEHENETSLSGEYDLSNLEIMGGTFSASLRGRADSDMTLTVKYKEYEPGDATVYISDGKIQTKSKSGKPVSIYNINGDIPEHLGLDIKTGTGDIELTGLKGRQKITIKSGTGDLDVTGSNFGTLSVKTGTGSITVRDSKIEAASIKVGTGDIILDNSSVNQQEFSTGTGKIIQKEANPAPKDRGSI